MEPRTFAFIFHSRSVEELKKSYPLFRMVPDFILKSSFRAITPFKVSQARNIRSIRGKEASGFFIDCPLLIEDGQSPEERVILGKIFAAAAMARKMGAKILGIDGSARLLKDNPQALARHLYLPCTDGSALTAWSVFEAVYRTAKAKGLDLKKASIAIIDAADPLANLSARKLGEYAGRIILNGRDTEKLAALKDILMNLSAVEVTIEEMKLRAIREADITVITGSGAGPIADMDNFGTDKIICYVSLVAALADKLKSLEGVTAVEAGLIKLPYPQELPFNVGLPKDVVSSALAETMLLALEEKFLNYSCGEDIHVDRLEEIADIAAKHGFEVWVPEAPLL